MSDTAGPTPAGDSGGTAALPLGPFEDPFVQLQRMPGSTFVEILEVRAREDATIFYCSGVRGLNVIDASDPANMKAVARLTSKLGDFSYPRCQHTAFAGELAYATNKGDEIQPTPFVAVFDLAKLEEIDAYTEAGRTFEGVAAAGDRAFVAMHGDGLAVLQVQDGRLQKVAVVAGFENAWGVAASGERVYVADGSGGLRIVDTSTTPPALVGHVGIGGNAQSVEVDAARGVAWVAAGSAGLVAVDVTQPASPRVLSTTDTPGSALQVALSGGRAYVADWNDARVFDIGDPASPVLVAAETVETGDPFSRVLGIGATADVAFLGEWSGLYSYRFHPGRPGPDIALSSERLSFRAPSGGEAAAALIVHNEGRAVLQIVEVSVEGGGGAFTAEPSSLSMTPGGKGVVEVTFKPEADAPNRARLALRSNDPDEPMRRIELDGNREGLGLGDPAPAVVSSLLDGGTWKLTDQSGTVALLAYFSTF